MFYWLGYEKLFHLYTPFRVFQYTTFRTGMAFFTAMLLSILMGPWLIARLREFQIGQHIREDGPKSHHKKAGTPTMGGLLIGASILFPVLLWANLRTPAVWVALAGLLSFGAVGFLDDYHEGSAQAQSRPDGAAKADSRDREPRCWSAFCFWP